MNKIVKIKQLQQQDLGPYQIGKRLRIDPKTVRKYMVQEDFSPPAPVIVNKLGKS